MKKILVTLLALAFLLNSNTAHSADKYIIDKSHTNIMWFASHFGFSDSMGQFMDFDGYILLDEESPENSKVEITIKADSIMTGLPKFDTHLKGKDFFNVEKYPEIKFVSTEILQDNKKSARVRGNISMLGQTQPLTLNTTLNKIGANPYSKKKTAGFTIIAVIKRSDFGMNYALPGVSDNVEILIETEALLEN